MKFIDEAKIEVVAGMAVTALHRFVAKNSGHSVARTAVMAAKAAASMP